MGVPTTSGICASVSKSVRSCITFQRNSAELAGASFLHQKVDQGGGSLVAKPLWTDIRDTVPLGIVASFARGISKVGPKAVWRRKPRALANQDEHEPGTELVSNLIANRNARLSGHDDWR